MARVDQCWASPAILKEYSVVLVDEPELLGIVQQRFEVAYPLLQLEIIKHEPDNRSSNAPLRLKPII